MSDLKDRIKDLGDRLDSVESKMKWIRRGVFREDRGKNEPIYHGIDLVDAIQMIIDYFDLQFEARPVIVLHKKVRK